MDEKSTHSRSAALGLWAALALCTTLVASRRLSGAYTGPLPTGALLLAVILAVTASVAGLWLFRRDQPRLDSSTLAWLPELTMWALPTVFGLVISASATPAQWGAVLGIVVLGAVVLGVAFLETTAWWQTAMAPTASIGVSSPSPAIQSVPVMSPLEIAPRDFDDGQVDGVGDELTTQWMTRREEPDGEAIEGTVRVHFAPGQREVVVHVTFCPPLRTLPEVELECVDGDDWQIKTEAALPYGLRIQVRRSTAITLEQTGRIAYLATSTVRSKAA